MEFDPRSALSAFLLGGAVLYGWWRYYRSGASTPPRWEGPVVATVVLTLFIALFVWQVVDP